jgi:hypothetical protein
LKLGIMQPYFFPYLGHFALIAHTDAWVVFDITQYTPKSWMNRNRVLHPIEGWSYVSVPLQNSSISIKTFEACISDVSATYKSILGKLSHYRKRAPYFSVVEALVHAAFAENFGESLVELNVRSLKVVCDYLDIPFHYEICSEMNLDIPQTMLPGKWAPTISGLLGASQYINPIGGRHLFDRADFIAKGIELCFLETPQFSYDTTPYRFESGLSILDVLMWNDPDKVREAIYSVKIVSY